MVSPACPPPIHAVMLQGGRPASCLCLLPWYHVFPTCCLSLLPSSESCCPLVPSASPRLPHCEPSSPLSPQPQRCHPHPLPPALQLAALLPGARPCPGCAHSWSHSCLQLVPRGHQPDGRRDAAEALQGGELLGAQQRDQQERLLPLLEVSESSWAAGRAHLRGSAALVRAARVALPRGTDAWERAPRIR